ncbi:MAG: 4-alpha-glucanotransferase [Candidatus Omnitrophica bacterium]|nr:4-alpha-glucanotransferase [Candidatus Omnitrophota bacterium]
MKIRFTIHFSAEWGRRISVTGSEAALGLWDPAKGLDLSYYPGGFWAGDVDIEADGNLNFEYKYVIKDDKGGCVWEKGYNRIFTTDSENSPAIKGLKFADVLDTWRPFPDTSSIFLTSAFRNVICSRALRGTKDVPVQRPRIKREGSTTARFKVSAPRLRSTDRIFVAGSASVLGNWDIKKALPLKSGEYPEWYLEVSDKSLDESFVYKYIIVDEKGNLVEYESGPDRFVPEIPGGPNGRIPLTSEKRLVFAHGDRFRYTSPWKGAGVAIPVFSIRSRNGLGTGEFLDLKLVVDWAKRSGFELIQLLPVNDTQASMTRADSYPYSNISVFALHPLYLNLEAIASLPKDLREKIDRRRKDLNSFDHVNYEKVMSAKLSLLKEIFSLSKEQFMKSRELEDFLSENSFWLRPYAAFSILRDINGSADPAKWGKYSSPKNSDIDELLSPSSPHYEKAAFTYFIQYHLHSQLDEASRYAGKMGVVLKGDIPIGINKHSDSCWTSPELFHMDRSAGAPPDPFSDTGQNWGFPTYDWGAMRKDGYDWWKKRLGIMSRYFQMIRLDHVLGFFRIWEIPDENISGLMGRFDPALPLRKDELEPEGIWDFDRLSKPYIPYWLIKMMFDSDLDEAMDSFLDRVGDRRFQLKPAYSTQALIEKNVVCPANAGDREKARIERFRSALSSLAANIVFLKDPDSEGFHPRMNMMDTCSFSCLDEWMQEKLINIYHDYFWRRHEDFWEKSGMEKLPALISASDMLICGEDLGMVPHCVKPVMEELGLVGLRVQRMPHKEGQEFGLPWEYEYLTVATTSTHDMSTLRGWWGENPAAAQRYYNSVLGHPGDAPSEFTPAIAREIFTQHLLAPSMWTIFPIQDILAMDPVLRRPGDPSEERINVPSNPGHYWKYRMHIDIETILGRKDLSGGLFDLLTSTKRRSEY